MPYPESCPECGGTFRNTGTHFTARRNEVGRHVLLELGCQTSSRRFWWDFTTGQMTDDGRPARAASREALLTTVSATRPAVATGAAATAVARAEATNGHSSNGSTNGHAQVPANLTNGHAAGAPPSRAASDSVVRSASVPAADTGSRGSSAPAGDAESHRPAATSADAPPRSTAAPTVSNGRTVSAPATPPVADASVGEPPSTSDLTSSIPFVDRGALPPAPAALKDAFVRQLQLDRLTLRQMRSWLMADEARRAIEVAAGATEATYERLALILFGADLPQLLGKQAPAPPPPSMSAEERLELQREKARIRARLRRAAIKAARQNDL